MRYVDRCSEIYTRTRATDSSLLCITQYCREVNRRSIKKLHFIDTKKKQDLPLQKDNAFIQSGWTCFFSHLSRNIRHSYVILTIHSWVIKLQCRREISDDLVKISSMEIDCSDYLWLALSRPIGSIYVHSWRNARN